MASVGAKAKNKMRKVEIEKGKAFSTRYRNRCEICGRPRGYIRLYKMCRICFRQKALKGEIPGVAKATW
jgi:small subunit ribosomal protein S14